MGIFELLPARVSFAGDVCATTGRSRSEIPVVIYQYEVNGRNYQNQTARGVNTS